jgi:N-acetyl-S-(2-succino)cysteine monooxygenase
MSAKRKFRLGAFIQATGHHISAWRHPNTQIDAGLNFEHYKEITQTAERGLFDAVFLADSPGIWGGSPETQIRKNLGLRRPVNRFAVQQQEKTLVLA